MTIELRESEGPDRTRGSIKCREFHDLKGTDLGGNSNICCCDPCTALNNMRESVVAKWAGGDAEQWCCRCVPRGIYLQFVPDDPDDPCCVSSGVPMFHQAPDPDADEQQSWSIYIGTMFGVTVTVHLGSIPTGDYDYYGDPVCAWRVWVKRGATLLSEDVFPLDGYAVECLTVPTGEIATNIEGPDGCMGSLYLAEIPKARLPFRERMDVRMFNDKRDPRDDPECAPDPYGNVPPQCDPMFINLCGECTEDELLYSTLTCLDVAGDEYTADGEDNGEPLYRNGDGERRIRWTGKRWTLEELPTSYLYYTGNDEWVELASGPTSTCPIGVWTQENDYQYFGFDDCFCVTRCDETDIREPCGCIGQVCSRICVAGPRHEDDDNTIIPYQDFLWFDDRTLDNKWAPHGWKYANPVLGFTEYIFLEESGNIRVDGVVWERTYRSYSFGFADWPYWKGKIDGVDSFVYWKADETSWAILKGGNEFAIGPTDPDNPFGDYTQINLPHQVFSVSQEEDLAQCRLRFQFEQTDLEEIYTESKTINQERGGSCRFTEVVSAPNRDPDDPMIMTLRCGFCSCMEFFCGECRCVPAELCVIFYDGETMHDNLILEWDAELKGWTADGSPLSLLLGANAAGQCVITPAFEDEYGNAYEPGGTLPIFDCGQESRTHQFDSDSEVLVAFYEDYTVPARPIYIVARSLTPECNRGQCTEATPCAANCGSHPAKLYMTLTQWSEAGDTSGGAVAPCTIEAELYFCETLDYIDPVSLYMRYSCWYVGFVNIGGTTCLAKIEVRAGNIEIVTPIAAQNGCVPVSKLYSLTESCNPYYGDTGVLIGEAVFPWSDLGCDDQTYRVRIILTE